MLEFTAIDFETANRYADSACSLAAVSIAGQSVMHEGYTLIKPPFNRFDEDNIRIHGITPQMVSAKPTFDALWPDIRERLNKRILIAHYAVFDTRVLRSLIKRYNLPGLDASYACTVEISRKVWPDLPNHKLDTVADHLGFTFPSPPSFRRCPCLCPNRLCRSRTYRGLIRRGFTDSHGTEIKAFLVHYYIILRRLFTMNIVLLESLGVTSQTLQSYSKELENLGHTFTAYERTDDTATLIKESADADILMIANMPLSGEVIRACKHLKYINIAFTGVDHVDLKAAEEMGVKVSNASGYSTVAVAELTLAMMLDLLRNVPQIDAACRRGQTKAGLIGGELEGKTVAIFGTGAIGTKVAQLVHAFGARVIAYNGFSSKPDTELITYLPLKELMQEADIVSLHCPVTDQSRGIINKESLSYMKPTAYLINEARGPVVNSQDLADALNNGSIAGAAIDVFETEPPIDVNHPLLHAKNTIVTPHAAFATHESMNKRAHIVFENIHTFLAGKQQNIIL